jgi:transcriptional regulator with XRE-family HTH domain
MQAREPGGIAFEQLGRELVRALRGRRSQVAFSRRLGYRTNVVYAWESGRRWPTAAILLGAVARSRIDVRAALGRFFPNPPSWLAEADPCTRDGVARLLSELRAKIPILEIAKRSGRSRYAVARWLSGAAEPRLPDFLRLVQACSLRLLDFVALFVDPALLPAAAPGWRLLQVHRKAAYDMPWIPAVLRALELGEYGRLRAHKPGWIAARIGISREEEARCLEVLAQSGQIREHAGRWVIGESLAVDTRQDAAAERLLKAHWAKVGLERLSAAAPGLFSFNVFTVSAGDLEKLRELHRSYFRTMRSIIAASEPADRVVVANVQLFALDDRAPPM